MKQATLCYLIKEGKICIGLKKRGFGKDRWNGFGGKVEENETLEESLTREVVEETGVSIKNPKKVAEIKFYFPLVPKEKEWDMVVHVYFAVDWIGEPTEGEEMKPQWFNLNEIPYGQMWDDDRVWLPIALGGQKLKAAFSFDENEKIGTQEVILVGDFDEGN